MRTPPPVLAQGRSRFTWRVALFIVVFVAIFGAAGYAVQWVATNSYYVTLDQGQVVIYQGRQGGLLWNQPTIIERTDSGINDVAPQFRSDVEAGRVQASLPEARSYVERIKLPPTTTTTTTSTVPVVEDPSVSTSVP